MPELTENDKQALAEIRKALRQQPTNWPLPDKFAIEIAQPLADLPPAQALQQAKKKLEELKKHNKALVDSLEKAKLDVAKLDTEPITNAGTPGLRGFVIRWFLSWLNATPFSLNWMEVTSKGLQLYSPLATVSMRTVTHKQIKDGEIVLSVDPPVYFDWILGMIRQFRKGVVSPWGEIAVYERGSGKTVFKAVAYRPTRKIDEMKAALAKVHRVNNPYEGHLQLPRMVDLLMYYEPEIWAQQESVESAETEE